MKRKIIKPRENWQQKVEQLGFGFHSIDNDYWNESAYYEFNYNQISYIEKSTNQLWQMCLEAVQYVIDNNLYDVFQIPKWFIPKITQSWNEDFPSVYGRFDLVYKDNKLKLLEFNADTPTSLFEASVIQWKWLEEVFTNKDQFNSIHEKIIEYFRVVKPYLNSEMLHFTCIKDSLEDLTTTQYIRDCAIQANLKTDFLFIDEIAWDYDFNQFLDLENNKIKSIFKLYPYEWLLEEDFSKNLLIDDAFWIEPPWKLILSNKAILPILWKLFPDHDLLLESYFSRKNLKNFVKKPIYSREGANITIVKNEKLLNQSFGNYGKEGFIFQELFELPNFEGNFPIIGSWIISQESAGIGIRESDTILTDNKSRFIPHLIDK